MDIISFEDLTDNRSPFLHKNKWPNLFYSEKWLHVLNSEYPFQFFGIHDQTNFLLAAKVNHFGLRKIKSLPFCDYTIPSLDNAVILNQFIEELQHRFPDRLIELKILLPSTISIEDLKHPAKLTSYCHIVDTSNKEMIEENMHSSFFRGVRKAQRNDLTSTFTRSKEAIDTFYNIYYKLRMNKFGKLPQPYSFFEKIWEEFVNNDSGFILEIRKNSTVIASAVILEHENRWYYKFGCSLEDYLELRPNNLLFYELFHSSNKKGIDEVDLGLSGVSKSYKGLVRFKEYMGGNRKNIYSLRLEPKNYDSSLEQEFKKFTSEMTNQIVSQQPDPKTASDFSNILYPYFA